MYPHVLWSVSDEEDTPSVFKALAARFQRYFTFVKIVHPDDRDLQTLGIADKKKLSLPELFVLVTENGDPQAASVVRFETSRHGNLNYTSVLQFLFAVNVRLRHELPGNNRADEQKYVEMIDIIRIEEKRFRIINSGHKENDTQLGHKSREKARLNENTALKTSPEEHVLRDEL